MAAPNVPSQTAPSNVANLDSWILGDGRYTWVLKMEPTDLAGSTATLYASTDTYRAQASPPRLLLPSVNISILNEGWGRNADDGRVDYDLFRAGQLSFGSFSILNEDGLYDGWVTDYGWGDAACTLLFGEDGGTVEEFMVFKVRGEPMFDFDRITFAVKGAILNPNGQIVTDVFAGTGTYAGEHEGGDDVEGQTKPLAVGKMDNVEPVLVDYATLRYMIDPGTVDAIRAVYEAGYDIGAAGTSWTDYGTTDGTFTLAAGQGLNKITCDVTGNALQGAGDYSLAANFKTLAVDYGGSAAPTVAGLTEVGGFFIESGENARFEEYLQWAIRPLGVYWPAQDGTKLLAGEIGSPEDGTSVQTYTEAHIESLERRETMPPVWQVRLGYNPIGEVLGDFVGAVDAATIAKLSAEFRYIVAEDATVLTDYPNAVALDADSSIFGSADAATLASELLAILKVKRDIYRVEVVRHPMAAWIGQVVTLDVARYGLSGGKKVMVTGWEVDLDSRRFIMECWG